MNQPTSVPQLLNRLRMRQVALLLAIDGTGTLGAAAREVGMTQPAATKMLRELESTLGQRLFDRAGRGLVLNAAGRRTLLSFRGIRGTMEQLQRELDALRLGHVGRLTIGSIMAAMPSYATHALARLKAALPMLEVVVEVGTSDRLMEQLDKGTLDAVIGRVPGSVAGYVFRPLAEEAISMICASDHPLARTRAPSFDRLAEFSWILPPKDSPTRDAIEQEFMDHHTPLPPGLLETPSTLITVQLVGQTRMIAVLPESVAKVFQEHRMLSTVRYSMRRRLASYGTIIRADRPLTPQTQRFLDLVHDAP